MEPQVILLVGAGRSGTNFIADALAKHPLVVNTYENRFIWNYCQRDKTSDYRSAEDATLKVRNYIRKSLSAMAPINGIVLDKTPGNALRLDFVRTILPNAKVVNVVRDGRASLASRLKMWGDQSDNSFGFKNIAGFRAEWNNARTMIRRGSLPRDRLPAFFWDSSKIVLRSALGQSRLAGERIAGLSEIRRVYGAEIARAIQWREIVSASTATGRKLPKAYYFEFRYEDLLRNPEILARRLVDFLDLSTPEPILNYLTTQADASRADAWRNGFPEERLARLDEFLRPTLNWLGYD